MLHPTVRPSGGLAGHKRAAEPPAVGDDSFPSVLSAQYPARNLTVCVPTNWISKASHMLCCRCNLKPSAGNGARPERCQWHRMLQPPLVQEAPAECPDNSARRL